MANYFVDVSLGTGDNDGSTIANALRGAGAIKTAMEIDHVAGTKVWIRRTSTHDGSAADIAPTTDGTLAAPVYFIGAPRPAIPNTTITQADWTNGSATVDNIVGITCARGAHQGRFATAPDGKQYLITRVVDTNTVMIDREYSGTTVTGTNGLFQIEADEDYAEFSAITDAATWTADAHTLPYIAFGANAYNLNMSADQCISFANIDFTGSTDVNGTVYYGSSVVGEFKGCLFSQTNNTYGLTVSTMALSIERCIFEGSGATNTSQHLLYVIGGFAKVKNCAVYNSGQNGIYVSAGLAQIINVNSGIEVANVGYDIALRNHGTIAVFGTDVRLGGSGTGYARAGWDGSANAKISIENYQKVLGSHKTFYSAGTWENANVSTGETPNVKLSDVCMKITPNVSGGITPLLGWRLTVFDAEFELASGSQTIKFWLYNDTGSTLNDTTATDNIYLRAYYCDSYDDTTEYHMAEAYSTQIDIADAADADDWDYLQVTVNPATASKVRVELILDYYDAAGDIFIDPEAVIT